MRGEKTGEKGVKGRILVIKVQRVRRMVRKV